MTPLALAGYNWLDAVPLVVLLLASVVGGRLVYRVIRDLQGGSTSLTEPEDLLGPLEEAYAGGQMSEEEYLRARAAIERAGFGSNDLRYWLPPRASAPPSEGPRPGLDHEPAPEPEAPRDAPAEQRDG
jgi:hypothetical protein